MLTKLFVRCVGKILAYLRWESLLFQRMLKGKKHVDRLDMVCVNSIANYTKKINDS